MNTPPTPGMLASLLLSKGHSDDAVIWAMDELATRLPEARPQCEYIKEQLR